MKRGLSLRYAGEKGVGAAASYISYHTFFLLMRLFIYLSNLWSHGDGLLVILKNRQTR